VDAPQVAALDRQVARLGRAGADDRRVVFLQEDLGLDVLADVGVADELDALLLHELDPAQDDLLLVELHVRDAVHEEPAGRSARSKTVTVCPARLSCAAAARPAGPEPMTATFLPVRTSGPPGDPALAPAAVDDRALDVLDRDRRAVDAEDAGALAGGRADAAR
jgi:hypothetical protein